MFQFPHLAIITTPLVHILQPLGGYVYAKPSRIAQDTTFCRIPALLVLGLPCNLAAQRSVSTIFQVGVPPFYLTLPVNIQPEILNFLYHCSTLSYLLSSR